ncbi:MAG TPA: PspC domain-containing protein [Mycobacteriales bacterium]|nr:PspC domain-containing protein [Mycobacteriales bacterium]
MTEQDGSSEPSGEKQLRRSKSERMLFGVCGGVGQYLGVDANILRVGVAILTVIGGSGIALYLIGALLIPEEGEDRSIAQKLLAKARD